MDKSGQLNCTIISSPKRSWSTFIILVASLANGNFLSSCGMTYFFSAVEVITKSSNSKIIFFCDWDSLKSMPNSNVCRKIGSTLQPSVAKWTCRCSALKQRTNKRALQKWWQVDSHHDTPPVHILCRWNVWIGDRGSALRAGYWTSGSDVFIDGAFRWCASPQQANISSLIKFMKGEPNNFGAKEHCLQAQVIADPFPDSFLFNDYSCEIVSKFICEVRIFS